MSLRIGPSRAGNGARARRSRWFVGALLVAIVFGMFSTPASGAGIPSPPGPVGLPPVPPTPSPQIVGGSDVPDGKYPFQTALLIESGGTTDPQRQFCGGSLISSRQVLTAAHCVDFFGPGPEQLPLSELRVVVGRTVLSSTQGQRRSVTGIDVHPRWERSTFSYDAAVITLAKPVRGIRPIQLVAPGFHALERPGRSAITSGWGNTLAQPASGGDGNTFFPDRMREVTVPIVSAHECDAAMTFDGVQFLDRNTMLCAGRTGRDTCQGDSGGPLFTKTVTGRYIQIGITSWGVGCAAAGFPGVYTKLSNRDIGQFIHRRSGHR